MIRMRGEIRSKNDDGSFIYDVSNTIYFQQLDNYLNNLSADFYEVLDSAGSFRKEFLFGAHAFSDSKTYRNIKSEAVITRAISGNEETSNGYEISNVVAAGYSYPLYIRGGNIHSFTIEFDIVNSVYPTMFSIVEYKRNNELPAYRPDENVHADYDIVKEEYFVKNNSSTYTFVSDNNPDLIRLIPKYLNKPNYPLVITRISGSEIFYLDKRNLLSSTISFGSAQNINEPEMGVVNYTDTIVVLDDIGVLQKMAIDGSLQGAEVVLWLEDTLTHRQEYYQHRFVDSVSYNDNTKEATIKISSNIKDLQSIVPDTFDSRTTDNLDNSQIWTNILMNYNASKTYISPQDAAFYLHQRESFDLYALYKTENSFWALLTTICECAGATLAIDKNGVYTFYASNSDSV